MSSDPYGEGVVCCSVVCWESGWGWGVDMRLFLSKAFSFSELNGSCSVLEDSSESAGFLGGSNRSEGIRGRAKGGASWLAVLVRWADRVCENERP